MTPVIDEAGKDAWNGSDNGSAFSIDGVVTFPDATAISSLPDVSDEATPEQKLKAQSNPLSVEPLAVEWYDDNGKDTRGREKRDEAFARARNRLDRLNLATASDIEAQAAYIEVVRTHPMFGYIDDDGSKTFGSTAEFGKGNARRMKALLDGSDPDVLYDEEYRNWKALSPEAQADLAAQKRGFVQKSVDMVTAPASSESNQSAIGGPALPVPVVKAPDPETRERIRKEYEVELQHKQRGAWFASVTADMSDIGKDWVKDALDTGHPDEMSLWVVPEADRGAALAAYRIAKGITDVNALTAGAMDAADSIKGMTAGALGLLNYVYQTTGGRAPSTGPRRAFLDEQETLRAQLAAASKTVFKEYGFGGQAIKGLLGSLPMMLSYTNPGTVALATLGMAEDARQNMLAEGIDPDVSASVALAVGVINSKIEQLQWERMTGANMSELQLRTYGLKAMVKALAKRDLLKAGRHVSKMTRHGAQVWGTELAEEVLQNITQESGAQLARDTLDVRALSDTFFNTIEQAAPTTFAFGLISGTGVGASTGSFFRRLQTKDSFANPDIAEIAKRRLLALHAVEQADNTDASPESAAKRAAEFIRELRSAWLAAPDTKSAMLILEDSGLDADTSAMLDDLFMQEAQIASESGLFRRLNAENIAADISPDAVRSISPAITFAERISDTETRATLKLADGKESVLIFRRGPLSRESNPARFDAQIRDSVGADTWDAMTEGERDSMRSRAEVPTFFEISDVDNTLGADGIITIAAPDGANAFYGPRQMDVYHETFHAAVLLARKAGVITDNHLSSLRNLFGDPRNDGEMFHEELAAAGYAEWLAGRSPDPSGVYKVLRDFFRRVYTALTGRPATRDAGAWTVNDVYEAVRTGRLERLPVSMGSDVLSVVAEASESPDTAAAISETPVQKTNADSDGVNRREFQRSDGTTGVMLFRRVPSVAERDNAAATSMLAEDVALPAEDSISAPEKTKSGFSLSGFATENNAVRAFSDGAYLRSGVTPVIEALYQIGGVKSVRQASLEAKSKGRSLGAEYDGAPRDLGPAWNRFVYNGTTAPDLAAQELADAGVIADAYPDTLWKAITDDVARYKAMRAQATDTATAAAQTARFEKDSVKPTAAAKERNPVWLPVSRLQPGDTVHVRVRKEGKFSDEALTVSAVDAQTGDVTLDDGKRYGRQELSATEVMYVHKVTDSTGKKVNTEKRGTDRFSLRLRGDPDDTAAAIVAARLLRNEGTSAEAVAKMLEGMGSKTPPTEVINRARAVSEGYRTQIRQAAESDRELLETLRQSAMEKRFYDRVDAVAGLAFREGSEEAKAAVMMAEAKRKTVQREIDSVEGFAAATLELEYGVDFAESLLASPVRKEPSAFGNDDSNVDTESAAEIPPELMAVTGRDNFEGPPVPVTAEARKAMENLLERARQRAEFDKAARAASNARRKNAAEVYGVDSESAAPSGAGINDNVSSLSPKDLVKRFAFTIDDPAHFRAMIEEMVIAKLSLRPGFNSDKPFAHPAALREFALTAKHVLKELADKLDPSTAREAVRLVLERLSGYQRLASLEGAIENVFSRIHGSMIRETREKMIAKLEIDIKRAAGARGQFQRGGDEMRRTVEGRTEEWARLVIGYLRLNDSELEAENSRLDSILDGRKKKVSSEDGYSLAYDRDYQQALDRKAALVAFGGLISRMPGEIDDAAGKIMEQIKVGRERLEARRDAQEERTQRMANQYAEAVENPAGDPMPNPGKWEMLADSLIGLFHLRLRDLIRYSRGVNRTRAERVINDVESMISRSSELRAVYVIKQREALRDGLKTIYGSHREAIKHLDTQLPDGVWQKLTNQNIRMTYGQLLNLYASSVQADYRDNAATHGRDKQINLMREMLTDKDMALLSWLRTWYRENRTMLDTAYMPVTGLSIQSPGETYMPVTPLRARFGLTSKVKAWSPLPPSLTPRIRHRLDFDETADVLHVWDSRLSDSANAIAFAETGLELAKVFGRDHLQERIVRTHGTAARSRLLNHLTDILRGGRNEDLAEGGTHAADTFRSWVTRFTLSGNIGTALKQVCTWPVFALRADMGLGEVMRYMAHVDPRSIRELMQSEGFKARYGAGASEEINNAMRGGSNWIGNLYNKGFAIPQAGNAIPVLWVGQGIYRSRQAHHIDEGMDAQSARRRALDETWAMIETTQQSSRTENLNALQRNGGGIGRLAYQFVSGQAMQLAYEVAAVREAIALKGEEGSRGRLARALFINHVLVPSLMTMTVSAFFAVRGFKPKEDDEKELWTKIIGPMIAGPSAGLIFIGAASDKGMAALVTGKKDWKNQGLPVLNFFELAQTIGLTAHDLVIETDTEKLQKDFIDIIKQTSAPGRHVVQMIQNYSE